MKIKILLILLLLAMALHPVSAIYIKNINYSRNVYTEVITNTGFKIIAAKVPTKSEAKFITHKEISIGGVNVTIPAYPLVVYPGKSVDISMHVETPGTKVCTDLLAARIFFNGTLVSNSEIKGHGILRVEGIVPSKGIASPVRLVYFSNGDENYKFVAYELTPVYVSAQKNLYNAYLKYKRIENNLLYSALHISDNVKWLLMDAITSFNSKNYEKSAVDSQSAMFLMNYGITWAGHSVVVGVCIGFIVGALIVYLYFWRSGLIAFRALVKEYFSAKYEGVEVPSRIVGLLQKAFTFNKNLKNCGILQRYYLNNSEGRDIFNELTELIKACRRQNK